MNSWSALSCGYASTDTMSRPRLADNAALAFAICSASCVWEHDRLSREASRTLEDLRAEAEQQLEPRRRRFGLLTRLRGELELDEDAAAVVALSAAGATVPQVPRHSFSLWNKVQVASRLGLGLGVVHRTDGFATVRTRGSTP